ncbi:MAG: hypothetical protein AAGJ83_13980 [Planctomycetota bacterium]
MKYNEVAVNVMEENNIRVNDLHEFVLPKMKQMLLPNNVHFRPSANVELAKLVMKELDAALGRSE